MTHPMKREFEHWLEADRQGNDDAADAACREAFQVLPSATVPLKFAADTMARLAAARAADAVRARRARMALLWGSAIAGPMAIYFSAGAVMWAVAAMLRGAVTLAVDATVRIASVSDWNLWALVGSLGRALGAIMSDADVTFIVIAMHGVAFAALIALQRLLGPDTESFK